MPALTTQGQARLRAVVLPGPVYQVACKRNAMKPSGSASEAGGGRGVPLPGQPEGVTVTVTTTGHPPILRFDSQPDGGPPPILCTGGHDFAFRPAAGRPCLSCDGAPTYSASSPAPGISAWPPSPAGAGCSAARSPGGNAIPGRWPAEHGPAAAALIPAEDRRAVHPPRRGSDPPAGPGLARNLADALHGHATADALTGFAEPFTTTAVSAAMGTPLADWDKILDASRIAFAVVPGPAAVDNVAAAWDDLYSYYARAAARPSGGLTAQLAWALNGHTATQIAHVTGTVSNGFGAMLPILAVAIAELARQPDVVASCTQGERTWASVAGELLSTRTMFPVALPRIALADTWLGGRPIAKGTTVLPSLIAAAHDGPVSPSIPFGAGPHYCPGAALTRVWLCAALEAFFGTFPRARLRVTWTGRRGRCRSPGR